MKMTMLRDAGYTGPGIAAYSDSSADLPLLKAAAKPVVVKIPSSMTARSSMASPSPPTRSLPPRR